jgi:Na+-transporting methylmalonyl-CoA/oxaloacetate decarboxylase gamma subunit
MKKPRIKISGVFYFLLLTACIMWCILQVSYRKQTSGEVKQDGSYSIIKVRSKILIKRR